MGSNDIDKHMDVKRENIVAIDNDIRKRRGNNKYGNIWLLEEGMIPFNT